MIPPRPERRHDTPILPVTGNWYGSTLRVYSLTLMLGIFYGVIPQRSFTRGRSAVPVEKISFRRARLTPAPYFVGASQR
jgi:hypothetical protein